jgi:tetratricopeptide (TPR) repeat protein
VIVTTRYGAELTKLRDLVGARRAYERALTMATDAHDAFNEGILRYNLAEVDEIAGKVDAAIAGYAAAANALGQDNFWGHCTSALFAKGTVEHDAGRLDAAADTASDAVLAGRRSGNLAMLESGSTLALRVAADRGDVALAHRSGQELLSLSRDDERVEEVHAILSRLPIASVG